MEYPPQHESDVMPAFPDTSPVPQHGQPSVGATPAGQQLLYPQYASLQPGYPKHYPATGQPSSTTDQPPYQGTMSYGMPPVTPTPRVTARRLRTRIIIAGIVVAALIIGTLIHVNGATGTAKHFMDDLLVTQSFDAAFALVCPSEQPALQASFEQLKSGYVRPQGLIAIDTSQMSYILKSSGFTTATVTFSGNITVTGTVNGTLQSRTDPVSSTDMQLAIQGLGWCLNGVPHFVLTL